MSFFVWNENFNVNVEKLDIQHKTLVHTINELYDSLYKFKRITEEQWYRDLFFMLEHYAAYHFSQEEEVLAERQSPDLDLQRKQHRFFADEIKRMKRDFGEGKSAGPQVLLSFSKTWLTGHILTLDKRIAELPEKAG